MRSLDYPSVKFYLIPGGDCPVTKANQKLMDLRNYFADTYPTAEFTVGECDSGKFDEKVRFIIEKNNIQLMIVPNKKSSALSRFFKPTLAHKILFEKDIPLVVIPV